MSALKRYIENCFIKVLLNSRVLKKLTFSLLQSPVIFGDERRVKIANSAQVQNAVMNVTSGNITIGNHVFFGHHVSLLTGTHDYELRDKERLMGYPQSGRDIIIEDGVWIASNVTVLGNVTLGKDSVICAGSVVIDDVPAGVVYGGNPAKFIKSINFTSK